MPLQKKLFVSQTALLLLFLGILCLGSFWIILSEVRHFEIERMRSLVIPSVYKRVVALEQSDLAAKTADWAKWQDTARFVEGGGKDLAYIESNLTEVPFESMHIHAMLFFDASGRFLHGKAFDPETRQLLPLPPALIRMDSGILQKVIHGPRDHEEAYLQGDGALYLVCLRRIIDPRKPDESKGVLLFARRFSPAYQKLLQEREIYPLAFRIKNHKDLETVDAIWEGQTIVGYLPLYDFTGKTVGQARIQVGGRIFPMLYRLFWLLGTSILAAVLFLTLSSTWLWRRFFLRPFSRLVQGIEAVGGKKDLKARLPVEKDNEFGVIAKSINDMLGGLERSRQIEENEARLMRILDNADTGVFTTINHRVIYSNPAMAQILGFEYPDAMIGQDIAAFFNDRDDFDRIEQGLRENAFVEIPLLVLKRNDGALVYGKYRAFALHGEEGLISEGYFTDFTEAYLANQKLDAAYRYYWEIFNQATEGVAVFDLSGRVHEANQALLELTGFSKEELFGTPFAWQSLLSQKDILRVQAVMKKAVEEKAEQRLELRAHRKDGKTLHLLVSYAGLTRQSSWPEDRLLGIHVDITALKGLQEELERLSFHDALTGLYNRAFFEKELKRLSQRRKGTLALVMADVDDLKKVNDNLGHAAGDALIKGAAQVLRQSFRPEDICARIGGDEFAVLLTDIEPQALDAVLARLREQIKATSQSGKYAIFSLSVGASFAHSPCDMNEQIKEADEKMYADKAEHKKRAAAQGKGVIKLPETGSLP